MLVAQSCLKLCNPRTVVCQTSLSMGLPKQEYWSGLPFPSPGDLPDPGIEPGSPALQADSKEILSLKRTSLKFFCATAWPRYPLGDKEHWPEDGSLNSKPSCSWTYSVRDKGSAQRAPVSKFSSN